MKINYLKNIQYLAISLAFMGNYAQAFSAYFDSFKHLPEKSLIKRECANAGFGNMLYDFTNKIFPNDTYKGCQYIHDILAQFSKTEFVFGAGRPSTSDKKAEKESQRILKYHVNAVLGEKYLPEQMRQEHALLHDTAIDIMRITQKSLEETERHTQDPY